LNNWPIGLIGVIGFNLISQISFASSASSGLLATSALLALVASVASRTSASLALLASLATSALLSALPAYQLFGFDSFMINHAATSSSMHTALPWCNQGLPKLPMRQYGSIVLLLYHAHLFVRESWLWHVLSRINSFFFRDAFQNAKQLFYISLPLTKYCIMRECENILCGYLYDGDLVIVILKGISIFKFFMEISYRDLTSFLLQLI
jgi:hypothetical protein